MDDLWAEGLMGTLISLTLGTLLCGVVGALIGHRRGRRTEGLILGLLLGPVGWLWVAVAPSRKPVCPECKGEVAAGARRCKNCGALLVTAMPAATPPAAPAASTPSPAEAPPPLRIATGIPTRPCPTCAREIPQAAVKCRHCGARIASPAGPP